MKNEYQKLVKFNRTMGIFHLIQAVIMLFLATSVIQQITEFSPTIVQSYLTFDFETESLITKSINVFTLPFGILVSVFLFISAGAHFLIVYKQKEYINDLKNGINKYRWYEYALSSSIMIVLISTLFGVFEYTALLLIFVVNGLMNIFGLIMEQINQKTDNVNWQPFIWGSVAGATPWIVIFIYILSSASLNMVPWFVWAIIGTYFVAFNTFPINMVLQYKKIGKWSDYLYGERVYIILSLVAKSILAWLVLFGAMQP